VNEVKKNVLWAPEARSQLRSVERDTALQILHAMTSLPMAGVM